MSNKTDLKLRELFPKDSFKRITWANAKEENLKENDTLYCYGKKDLIKLSERYSKSEGIIRVFNQTFSKDFTKDYFSEYFGKKITLQKVLRDFDLIQSKKSNTRIVFLSKVPIDLYGAKVKDTFDSKLYQEEITEDAKEIKPKKIIRKVKKSSKPFTGKNSQMSPIGSAMEQLRDYFEEQVESKVNDKVDKENSTESIKEEQVSQDLIPNTVYNLSVEDFITEAFKGAIFEDPFGHELYYDKGEVNPFIYANTPIMYWGIFDSKTPYKFIRYKTNKEQSLVKKYKIYKGAASFIIETDNLVKTLQELGGSRYEELS